MLNMPRYEAERLCVAAKRIVYKVLQFYNPVEGETHMLFIQSPVPFRLRQYDMLVRIEDN